VLNNGGDALLEKYTISNALALSVKLGTWEAALERYIDSIEYVTEVSFQEKVEIFLV
jgi:glutathione synthase